MPREHVDQLFSAAYDDDLDAATRQRFDQHLEHCEECSHSYEAFRQSIGALRALPHARMPRPVHIPSTPPVAERRTAVRRLRALRLPRLVPGSATAVAAVAAAVIVVIVSRGGSTTSNRPSAGNARGAQPVAGSEASCVMGLGSLELSGPPADFEHRVDAVDAERPGQQLVLATRSGDVRAGAQVPVYALLTVPRPGAASPGARVPMVSLSVLPCVTVTSAGAFTAVTPGAAPASPVPLTMPAPSDERKVVGSGQPPLLTFQVPAGVPGGTQLHITATVPPGYPDPTDPPLTVDLLLTVR